MLTKTKSSRHSNPLLLFFFLAIGITWVFSAFVYFIRLDSASSLLLTVTKSASILFTLLGPALAAISTASLFDGSKGVQRLLARLRLVRIDPGWYVFIFAYPIGLHISVAGIDYYIRDVSPRFFTSSSASIPTGNVLILTLGLIIINLIRGFGEELGWRGYALPRLQSRWNAVQSSLILGLVWSLWHYHPSNFAGLIQFSIWYPLLVLPTSIIFTCVMNCTQGSLWSVILLHTMLDLAEWVVPVGLYEGNVRQMIVNVLLNWIIASLLVARYGTKNLSHQPRVQYPIDFHLNTEIYSENVNALRKG
jgi:membrane protease YdiL (CAAX protease family)